MPRHPVRPVPRSRYSYELATMEVERLLARLGRGSHTRAAESLGMSASQFAKRMAATGDSGERFRIEHFGALADWARAPIGWPLVSWEQGESMETAIRRRRG